MMNLDPQHSFEKNIGKKEKNEGGLAVNWFKTKWMIFTQDNLYTMFYKDALNHDVQFDKLILPPAKKKSAFYVG